MIDDTFSTRMSLLSVRAEKNAYTLALGAIDRIPIKEAREFIQEALDGCEDLEIIFERKIDGLTPKHSCL